MKKSLWMLGVALTALASCAETEVVDVPQTRAIGFTNAFVNNTTRADVTTDTFGKFWVFGDYDNDGSWANVFSNIEVTKGSPAWKPEQTAYWQLNKNYNFGAYADGTNTLSGVTYTPASNTLNFSEYSAGENDLVAATVTNQSWDGQGEPSAVPFTFHHMLSKVKFTFKTVAAETYTIKVSGLTISDAIQTGNGSFTGNQTGTWSGETTGSYAFAEIADYATAAGQAESEVKYVIPQANTNDIAVAFTVTVSDASGQIAEGTFEGTMAFPDANEWEAGMAYNYVVTINPPDVDATQKPIEFTVTEVDKWDEFDDTDTSVDLQ